MMRAQIVAITVAASTLLIAQTAAPFRRGELVRVADVKTPAVVKIVGLPDEIVEANETGVFVDDAPVTGFSREFLTRHRLGRQYIPMDHYFVLGEERKADGTVSEHIGIHQAASIERAE
jgi:hypothetical protein